MARGGVVDVVEAHGESNCQASWRDKFMAMIKSMPMMFARYRLLICRHTDRHQIAPDFPKPIFSANESLIS